MKFSWEDPQTKDRKLQLILVCKEDGYEKKKIEVHPDVVSSTCK